MRPVLRTPHPRTCRLEPVRTRARRQTSSAPRPAQTQADTEAAAGRRFEELFIGRQVSDSRLSQRTDQPACQEAFHPTPCAGMDMPARVSLHVQARHRAVASVAARATGTGPAPRAHVAARRRCSRPRSRLARRRPRRCRWPRAGRAAAWARARRSRRWGPAPACAGGRRRCLGPTHSMDWRPAAPPRGQRRFVATGGGRARGATAGERRVSAVSVAPEAGRCGPSRRSRPSASLLPPSSRSA